MQHWLDYKRENSRTYSRAFISNMYKKNGPSTCQATVVRESCFYCFKCVQCSGGNVFFFTCIDKYFPAALPVNEWKGLFLAAGERCGYFYSFANLPLLLPPASRFYMQHNHELKKKKQDRKVVNLAGWFSNHWHMCTFEKGLRGGGGGGGEGGGRRQETEKRLRGWTEMADDPALFNLH